MPFQLGKIFDSVKLTYLLDVGDVTACITLTELFMRRGVIASRYVFWRSACSKPPGPQSDGFYHRFRYSI